MRVATIKTYYMYTCKYTCNYMYLPNKHSETIPATAISKGCFEMYRHIVLSRLNPLPNSNSNIVTLSRLFSYYIKPHPLFFNVNQLINIHEPCPLLSN